MTTATPEPQWFKSSLSDNGSGCLEAAFNLFPHTGEVLLRDSKNPDTTLIRLNETEWRAFLGGVHAGEFEL